MKTEAYVDEEIQNAFYGGYTQTEEINNRFLFNFFGKLMYPAVNFLRSWNDKKGAGESGLYFTDLSDEYTPLGHDILRDIAFVNNMQKTSGKVLRGRKTNEFWDVPMSAELAAINILMQRVNPGERKSAAWSVRDIKGPFKRLMCEISADS